MPGVYGHLKISLIGKPGALFTIVKARESDVWACPTWQNIDMAGAVLEVKFPEADMKK